MKKVLLEELKKSKDSTERKKEGKLVIGEYDWTQCEEFINIEKQVMENTVVDLNDCVFISNEDKLKHPEYFI